MKFSYKFPAVRGVQANREYYISMVPMNLLSRLFPLEEDIVLPEYRAQRKINEYRIPDIKSYILDNRDTYVFSALSASIDGEFSFTSNDNSDVGYLEVDMNAVFLINDGQHRKAAIEAAIQEAPELGEETISIVFFKDDGLERSQQMFTDLNKHAVKTSNSLSTLYDSRDELAVATKKVIDTVSFFAKYTDKERDNLGKNSSKLFTLNSIYKANQKIIHGNSCSDEDTEFLISYWKCVADNITEWKDVTTREITKKDLRENYIISLSMTLISLGRVGRYFYDNRDEDMQAILRKLRVIDWSRNNTENWMNRAIRNNGKVMNNEEAIYLTASKIKDLLGIKLSLDEERREKKFIRNGDK